MMVKNITYIKIILFTALSAFITFIVLGSSYVYYRLAHQDVSNESRLAYVQLLPKNVRESAIILFAGKVNKIKHNDKTLVCVFGDSEPYGYLIKTKYVFHKIIADYNSNLEGYNFSVIDGHLNDTLNVMKIVEASKLMCDFVVFNLTPHHLNTKLINQNHVVLNKNNIVSERNMFMNLLTTNEFSFFSHWYDLFKMDLFTTQEPAPVGFQMRADKEYFANLDEKMAFVNLDAVITQAKKIGHHVIAYATPSYYADYNKSPYNFGWDTTSAQTNLVNYCNHHTGITCVNWSNSLDKAMFFDLLHLNKDGHRNLAKLVADKINEIQANTETHYGEHLG